MYGVDTSGWAEMLLDFSDARVYPAVPLQPLCPPRQTVCMDVAIPPNMVIKRGTVMSESSTRGTFIPYDGTLQARGLLKFDAWSDATGLVTVDGPYVSWPQLQYLVVPVYLIGEFATNFLIGLTDAAVRDMGRILRGNLADGVLELR